MQDLKGKRVAAYARYSTDRQNAASIPDQLRVCREYAERRGGAVDDTLIFTDRAISGASAARPGLHALQAAAEDGCMDVVLTEDLSRIGRSVGNNDRLLKWFIQNGVRLVAINDGFDTGERKAKLLGAVKSAMAEDYLDELKERTKRGMDGLFEAGMFTGGKVYGYRSEPAADGTERRRLVIDAAQADVVRRIFTMWANGNSQKIIAMTLNDQGLPSPRGGKWGHITIRAILHNELYIGNVVFNRRAWQRDEDTGKRRYVERPRSEWRSREDPTLAVVEPGLWQRAQDRLARTARQYKGGNLTKRSHPLSGLLQCTLCESDMVIAGSGRYYRCGSAQRGHGCNNRRSLAEPAIRAWLLDRIIEVAGKDELLDEIRTGLAEAIGRHNGELKQELKERRATLSRLQARLSKLLDLILDGDDSHAMRAKRAELEEHVDLQRNATQRLERQLSAELAERRL